MEEIDEGAYGKRAWDNGSRCTANASGATTREPYAFQWSLNQRRATLDADAAFAGQKIGIKAVEDRIWLVSFMHCDQGYFDHAACTLEPIKNPFAAKVLPMSPV